MRVSGDKELTHIIDFTCSRKTLYSLVCTEMQNVTPNTPDCVECPGLSHGDLLNYILKQRPYILTERLSPVLQGGCWKDH